jgi:hypothetical protein
MSLFLLSDSCVTCIEPSNKLQHTLWVVLQATGCDVQLQVVLQPPAAVRVPTPAAIVPAAAETAVAAAAVAG